MHRVAVRWMVGLPEDRNIPFLICGGLAARGYGPERALNDIDPFVPGEHFSSVGQAGQAFASKAAAHRREEGWSLTYVQFSYQGVKVEMGSADGPRVLDAGKLLTRTTKEHDR
ncbi:hypothetical protein QLQ86_04805 [Halomonas sp. LR5S13]|uniref:hypothetical protein n=1 Tax=Halomonas rhizosphaerae TaxID=3043296 RepID=UPI0024A8A30C|nr:hypothetical protein [Halomonas rhizosphaerae]MDI5920106.1 hypothetical protein [Halomonas rhizosphaerae]